MKSVSCNSSTKFFVSLAQCAGAFLHKGSWKAKEGPSGGDFFLEELAVVLSVHCAVAEVDDADAIGIDRAPHHERRAHVLVRWHRALLSKILAHPASDSHLTGRAVDLDGRLVRKEDLGPVFSRGRTANIRLAYASLLLLCTFVR